MSSKVEKFDVLSVPLEGKNLIEASAGTGKTYSLAMLALRMLVEENTPIENMLIVTFTKAAVAELKVRVRLYFSLALDYVNGKEVEEKAIISICDKVSNKSQLKDNLKAALLRYDEASIFTIHGFCQQMLSEFAFETKQNFNAELREDVSEFVEQIVNDFWRKELSNLPIGALSISDLDRIRKELKGLFIKGLNNIELIVPENCQGKENGKILIEDVLKFPQDLEQKEAEVLSYLQDNYDEISNDVKSVKNSAPLKKLLDNLENLLTKVKKDFAKSDRANYYSLLENPFWEMIEELVIFEKNEIQNRKNLLFQSLFLLAQQDYLPKLKTLLKDQNVHTFDSLINNLHKSVVLDNNLRLKTLISERFPVVFIDEFQDTDVVQFELFEKLFIEPNSEDEIDSRVFLIGDPKQSIYEFRNADVENYLHAASKVDHIYTMNTNFRSSEKMIAATNTFFESSGASAFGYEEADEQKIDFHPVESAKSLKALLRNGEPVVESLFVAGSKNQPEAFENLTNAIAALLTLENNYQIQDAQGNRRAISPQDIAVLVRGKSAAPDIKALLLKKNIPAVSINENNVFKSQEAKDLSILLQAILEPSIDKVKAAIYLSFLQDIYVSKEETAIPILALEELSMMSLFKGYQTLAEEESVFQAISKLMGDFNVQQSLSTDQSAQRRLANLLQLLEILNEQQYRQELSPEELWAWLKTQISTDELDNNTYTQQIESDETAVNILTIHKSKGLEFPIVFVYGLYSTPKDRGDELVQIKDENSKRILKFTSSLSEAEEDQRSLKEEQESRRLIYVALTRSVFQSYIFYSIGKSENAFLESILNSFLQNIQPSEEINLDFSLAEDVEIAGTIVKNDAELTPITLDKALASKSQADWAVYSFSSLSKKHSIEPKPKSGTLKDYDFFIYNQLGRGAQIGTKLHELFEKLNFKTNYSKTEELAAEVKERFLKLKLDRGREDKAFLANVSQLIMHVLEAKISFGDSRFQLKEVGNERKLIELEFDFPVAQSSVHNSIKTLLEEYQTGFDSKYYSLKGMLTGFIDLVFEQEGKYYILDWKSNYLGYDLSFYEKENLKVAMNENQYTLQYLIYTVALHRYLQLRLGEDYDYDKHFGGVIYVFLRGARQGETAGIFTDRPSKVFIEQLNYLLSMER